MSNVENFEVIVNKLIAACPSQKAVEFTNKIADQIRARGTEWIEANAQALAIKTIPSDDIAPIGDNRMFIMGKFQTALRNL